MTAAHISSWPADAREMNRPMSNHLLAYAFQKVIRRIFVTIQDPLYSIWICRNATYIDEKSNRSDCVFINHPEISSRQRMTLNNHVRAGRRPRGHKNPLDFRSDRERPLAAALLWQ